MPHVGKIRPTVARDTFSSMKEHKSALLAGFCVGNAPKPEPCPHIFG